MEGSIQTPEGFWSVSGTYRSTGGVTGTPREKIWAIGGKLTNPQGLVRPPQGQRPNWIREGGGAPLSFSYSLSLPLSTSMRRKRRGRILLGLGVLVALPLMARPLGPASSLSLLYIRGQGTPWRHTNCSKPCAASLSTVYSSGHIHVVLRRSPARITSPSPSPRH